MRGESVDDGGEEGFSDAVAAEFRGDADVEGVGARRTVGRMVERSTSDEGFADEGVADVDIHGTDDDVVGRVRRRRGVGDDAPSSKRLDVDGALSIVWFGAPVDGVREIDESGGIRRNERGKGDDTHTHALKLGLSKFLTQYPIAPPI